MDTRYLDKKDFCATEHLFAMAMKLWLSTSTLDTWAHGQSLVGEYSDVQ